MALLALGLPISPIQLRELTRVYFVYFHPPYLILDEECFYSRHLNRALQNNFRDGVGSCIALLVFALGAIAAYPWEMTTGALLDSHDAAAEGWVLRGSSSALLAKYSRRRDGRLAWWCGASC